MTNKFYTIEMNSLIDQANEQFKGTASPSVEEITQWVSASPLPNLIATPGDFNPNSVISPNVMGAAGGVNIDYEVKQEIVGLDPATAGVIASGLVAFLGYAATERRHKETLVSEKEKLLVVPCPHVDENSQQCGEPILDVKIILDELKKSYIVRTCGNVNGAHQIVTSLKE